MRRFYAWLLSFLFLCTVAGYWAVQQYMVPSAPPIEETLAEADRLYASGEHGQAIADLEDALVVYPQASWQPIHERLGRWQHEIGQIEEAAFHLRLARSLGSDAETTVRLIEVNMDLGRLDEAAALLGELPEDDPRTDTLGELIRAEPLPPQEASSIYRRLLAKQPNLNRAILRLAKIKLDQGRHDRAFEALKPGLASSPDNIELLRMAGQAAFLAGDYAASQRYHERAAAQYQGPGLAPDLIQAARAMLRQGDHTAANELLDELLDERPAHLEAQFFRALGALRVGDYQTAYRYAQEIVERDPEHIDALLLAGAAALGTGDADWASSHLTRYLQRRQDDKLAADLLQRADRLANQIAAGQGQAEGPAGDGAMEDSALQEMIGQILR